MTDAEKQIALESAQANMAIAIRELKKAKGRLLAIKNDQFIPLAVSLSSLEMVFEILTDPDETPDFVGGGEENCSLRSHS